MTIKAITAVGIIFAVLFLGGREGKFRKRENYLGTIIVLLAVLGAAAGAVRSIVKNKKHGKSVLCSGDCRRCGRKCR